MDNGSFKVLNLEFMFYSGATKLYNFQVEKRSSNVQIMKLL